MTTMSEPPVAGATKQPDESPAQRAAREANLTLRVSWFSDFGIDGHDDDAVITLRNRLGTATVADVWAVRQGLQLLFADYPTLFHRTGGWAHMERQPLDPTGQLNNKLYGALTNIRSGEWLPGRREIVMALLDLDEDGILAEFAENPFANET